MARDQSTDGLHIFFFPWLANSHIIAMADMARIFADRPGVRVSFITTTGNAARCRRTVEAAGRRMELILLPFPSAKVGLPPGVESTSCMILPTPSDLAKLYHGAALLREPLHRLIADRGGDCIVADNAYNWTADLGVPRIGFEPGCPFNAALYKTLVDASLSGELDKDVGPVVAVDAKLPHRIELVRSEMWMQLKFHEFLIPAKELEARTFGVLTNCFYELTPEYVDYYNDAVLGGGGRRMWCLGPVWLCNKSAADQAERGGDASSDKWEGVKRSWLDKQEDGSVLYVCFGSECSVLSRTQFHEIAAGLESSGRPFLWVVRADEDWVPQGFEERMREKEKGVVFRGWAPQLQALNHPAVGGFLTHCGWNSTIEAVSAGVAMVAWPLQWEQFINERMITEVLKIGVRVVEGAARTEGKEKEIVKAEAVGAAVLRLMGGGEEAVAMRRRAEEYKEKARLAMEEGGSSRANLVRLVEELTALAKKRRAAETA